MLNTNFRQILERKEAQLRILVTASYPQSSLFRFPYPIDFLQQTVTLKAANRIINFSNLLSGIDLLKFHDQSRSIYRNLRTLYPGFGDSSTATELRQTCHAEYGAQARHIPETLFPEHFWVTSLLDWGFLLDSLILK